MALKADSGPDEPQPLKATLKDRLLAWWEGYDVETLRRLRGAGQGADGDVMRAGGGGDHAAVGKGAPGKEAASASRAAGMNRSGKPLWTATRVQVVEQIWGDGFATPGGTDFIPTLVKPMGLNSSMSVLDLGAGLGGAARAMASTFGAWVTGLEANPVLAEAGMLRSHKAGLSRQAPVQLYNPESFVWNKKVDAVFSKEAFYTVKNKDSLLDVVEANLKPRGHFLFTDYVLNPAAAGGPLFKGWMATEPLEPDPWTVEQYAAAMAQRNLDIRITEDVSDTHRSLVLTAIQGLVKHLENHSMDHATKVAVVEEVELWARRVAVLDAGIRVYRFYVLKPAELE